ncbi:hypothetical protein HHI36_000148 [Cryptolaemus montrouzieri]|uniref:Uncharacterized protein n=1 Tax=Cryptolaemus montrouzieri TaxID=559131 RepID=A0ABD2P4W7_9CUCU
MNVNIIPNGKENKQQIYNPSIQEYSSNRMHSSSKKVDNVVDQFSDYPKRKDSPMQSTDLSASQGTLYSVSQRVPNVNTSCNSLCNTDSGYVKEQKGHQVSSNEWKKDEMGNDIQNESSSEGCSDRHTAVLDRLLVITMVGP